ncbi:unnamed protein product, partial [Mesorhabditis spiculigera]
MIYMMSSTPSPNPATQPSLPVSPLNLLAAMQLPNPAVTTQQLIATTLANPILLQQPTPQVSLQSPLESILQQVGLYSNSLQVQIPTVSTVPTTTCIDQQFGNVSLAQLISPLGQISLPSPNLSVSPSAYQFPSATSAFQVPISPANVANLPLGIPQIVTPIPALSVSPSSANGSTFSLLASPTNAADFFQLTTNKDELEIPTCSFNRRLSAPEACRKRPRSPERNRRFSDFTIGQLLRVPAMGGQSVQQPREKSQKRRKQRTIYGMKQTEVLEEAFVSQRYMVGAEREQLASSLALSEAQVRVWFQNRRSKQRKLNRQAGEPEVPGARL